MPDPDGLVTAAPTTIRNESALGIYVFAWTSASGTRCELCWYEGLDVPCFSFWIGAQGRMCPPIAVRDPERFGWEPPRKVADFKAFAQRFADALRSRAVMAPTTAGQFARALRRLGATTTIRDGCDVIASYQGVQVTAHFHPDADAFDIAWRADVAPDAASAIRSMAGVKRALGLPKQPIVIFTGTGRRNSRTHIVRAGFTYFAECGVGLDGRGAEGSISDVTCPRCRSIWPQR